MRRCVFQSLNQWAVQAGATVFFFGGTLGLLHRSARDIERGLQRLAELRRDMVDAARFEWRFLHLRETREIIAPH